MKSEARHLKLADYEVQPWKNGKGETRQIAADAESPYRWRLSWASLSASGPFSPFEGYDRVLVLLSGGPLELSHSNGKSRRVEPLLPYSFKGDLATEAKIALAGEDFNVFTRQGRARAGVYPAFLSEGEELQFPMMGTEHFLFAVEGACEVLDPNSGASAALDARETFRLSRRAAGELLNLRVRGRGPRTSCLWIVVHELA
jgi:environmental stress-induced protein Ves